VGKGEFYRGLMDISTYCNARDQRRPEVVKTLVFVRQQENFYLRMKIEDIRKLSIIIESI
jgi:hypothetical protein